MENIKEIVNTVIGKISIKEGFSQNKIDSIWKNILNEKELEHTKIIGIKDGCILVNVDSPAWLYQMRINYKKILSRLNAELSEIKKISFKIGKVI